MVTQGGELDVLRAVYDDGNHHSEGRVRSTWSSGIVVETDARPGIGSPVALVILSGGFDGQRLTARVSAVEKNALVLELPGLDTPRWMRLVALVDGKPLPDTVFSTKAPPAPPPFAPTIILSSNADDLDGDPTGTISLTPEMRKSPSAEARAVAEITSPFERVPPKPTVASVSSVAKPLAPAPVTVPGVKGALSTEELEQQLVDLGRKNATLTEENRRLQGELTRIKAMKGVVDDELADALSRLDAIEKALKRR